jgi:hypothetical protein
MLPLFGEVVRIEQVEDLSEQCSGAPSLGESER